MNDPSLDPTNLLSNSHHNQNTELAQILHGSGHTTPTGTNPRKRKATVDSDHSGLTPGNAPAAPRNPNSTSSRGVASLTPEQLAKKRANDREAQRAIRERTKNTIETLERRIAELTAQQPYQELQIVIRQKEAIQAENEEIRRRLASVLSILQPVVGAQGLADLASAAQQNAQLGLEQTNANTNGTGSNLFSQYQYTGNLGPQPRPYATQPGVDQNDNTNDFASNEQDQEHDDDNSVWTNSRTALSMQRESIQRNHELNETGERLNLNFLLGGVNNGNKAQLYPVPRRDYANGRGPHPTPFPHIDQAPFPQANGGVDGMSSNHGQPSANLPKNSAPTCPLDHILLNFLSARQRENAATVSPSYTSPAYPSVSSLLNPSGEGGQGVSTTASSPASGRAPKPIDPLSHLMTSIISKFPAISGLPEQAATLFYMFLYMKWQISPTNENFSRLPPWLRPTDTQLTVAHPAWIDHLVWPQLRDALVLNQSSYPFENWFLPFTTGLRVNWPYEDVDCLIQTEEGAEPVINPVFERHIRRVENWSVGPQLAEAFPELKNCVCIRDPQQKWQVQNHQRFDGNVNEHGNIMPILP